MKKILLPLLLFVASLCSAQFNNSWIDYSKTYYKFKIANDSLCRIPQPALAAAGLASISADKFQLWHNGKEVRLYTSVNTGPLSASDYIEFWGEMNDGKPDKELYRVTDDQLNDRYSLETDTSAYFLTVNLTGNNLRYTDAANNPPGTMTPDAYFMRKIDMYFKTQMNRGRAEPLGEYIYSSAYDAGEGWTSADVAPCCDLTQEFFNMNVYTGAPTNSVSFRLNTFGNAPNSRNVRARIWNTVIVDQALNFFTGKKITVNNLPLSLLLDPNHAILTVNCNNPSVPLDRLVVASIGLTYPAQFNFNGLKNFYFELAASASGNYLVIDNFNFGSTAPALYDMNTGNRYTGDISTPGKVKFVLPPSSDPLRKFMLVNMEPNNYQNVTTLTRRDFVNLNNAQEQSTFMLIANPILYNDGNGNNNVAEYKNYRSSAAGGGYNTKVYEIDELTDQFAFGIKKHPAAIRDFVRFANQQFSPKPQYVLLLGRGINYIDQRKNESNPITDKLDLITTFGWPASDMLLVSEPGKVNPIIPVGRIAAITGTELGNYLQKLKQYDQVQQTSGSTISSRAWMKNMIHVAGGKESGESESFRQYMNGYKTIAEDTLYGGYVETFTKTSTGAIQQASSQRIQDLFQEGLSFIGYFGHSSANFFEFNLSNPELYNNQGKYPFFNVSGCSAGNFYIYDPVRLSGSMTLSEKYVLANQHGSIGFLADSHFGVPPFLNYYNTNFYTNFGKTMYGNTVGNQIKQVIIDLGGNNSSTDFYTRIHLEEINLHGDPAVKINNFTKPDYVIESQLIKISPNIITVAESNFNVKIKMVNMGRAVSDSILVTVKRKLASGAITTLFSQKIAGIKNTDSLNLTVPINAATDKGLNQLIVSLDVNNDVDELYETNNSITKDFFIFEDELRPAYPYNFSIINSQNLTFIANTANPLSGVRQYNMEIDTTELFNSPLKRSFSTTGPGGIVEFTPSNFTFTDSTVYYWRVSMVPTGTADVIWNTSSFVYLPTGGTGFNQSHFYQHQKSKYTNIALNNTNRNFVFEQVPRNLIIRTGLYPYYNYDRINVNLDFQQLELYGCIYNNLQVYVFDSTTLLPWDNRNVSPTNGMYGSYPVCRNSAIQDTTRRFFEFPYNSSTYRKAAMDFLDAIPNGMYIAITNLGNKNSNSVFVDQWKADTLLYGSGNSLYHKLKSIGFTQIDSFSRNLPFLYFYRKGTPSYTPTQVMGAQDSSYIDQTFQLNSTNTSGSIESAQYGPAAQWQSMHWRGFTVDPTIGQDTVRIEVYGIEHNGNATKLATVDPSTDTSLAFVDARVYPYLKLKMLNSDPTYATPHQLRYLRVNASYVPEGAIAPNLLLQTQDTLQQGQDFQFKIAFKNISPVAFDSLLRSRITITDRNNVAHNIEIPKRKALVAGDTLLVNWNINTSNYPGVNTLLMDFNPENDQPEQYHTNNVLFKEFYVKEDVYNPLLDVTFDGVHILNRDIVSAKPAIVIRLKDESRFLELKDTSLLQVKLKYEDDDVAHIVPFSDTMRFTPANLATGQNTATIDYTPYFERDGEYELTVSGKDNAGNHAGALDYRVLFNVVNKPMISNMLNYPNPFTTSTAFVFTVTGSEVPQNIRIQIMTITGKIVKEITKDELGPIHIGRNITEYKWDGTDAYGQKLANGVYLYRVITNLNGKKLDKYETETSTDKFFKKGYGKMYLMR